MTRTTPGSAGISGQPVSGGGGGNEAEVLRKGWKVEKERNGENALGEDGESEKLVAGSEEPATEALNRRAEIRLYPRCG
jgi:hypothetical protein